MEIYKDYLTKSGRWVTFRPLPVIKREELARRFNSLKDTVTIKHQLINDDDDYVYYTISQILALYGLNIDDLDIDEIDTIFLEYIIPVNFRAVSYESPELPTNNDEDTISVLLNSVWGVCDNAGDAMYLMDKLPAEILLQTVTLRAKDLERIYSTDKQKRDKEGKKLKEQLLKNHGYQNSQTSL